MPEFRTQKEAREWYAGRKMRNSGVSFPAQMGKVAGSANGGGCDSAADFTPLNEMMAKVRNGDFDAIMVEHAEQVPVAAYDLYLQATRAGNDAQVSVRIKNWGEASKQAAAVREKFIELQEKTGQLLPMDIMLDVVGTILQAIVSSLDTMGSRIAKQANPENPDLALRVINEAIDEVKGRVNESKARVKAEILSRRDFVDAKTQEEEK
jgi:hypothetical protein